MAAKPQAIATSTNETEMAGPAPARPLSVAALPPFKSRSSTGALRIDLPRKCSPAAAVPVTVKIPDPITAPMPRAMRLPTPSDFLSRRSGSSEEAISASMLLVRRSEDMSSGVPVRALSGGSAYKLLALRLPLGHFSDFLLHRTARNPSSALGLGSGLLARGALDLLAFCLICYVFCVHSSWIPAYFSISFLRP